MEIRDDQHRDDNSSDQEDIDLELQDDETQVNQEPPQEQVVIGHLYEIGEYVDYQQPQTHKWITMKILDIQNHNIRLQSVENQNSFWTPFDYDTIRKQWIPGVPLTPSRVEVLNPVKGLIEGQILYGERDKAFVHHIGYKKIYDQQYLIKDIFPLGQKTNTKGMGTLLNQQPQNLIRFQHRFNLYMQIKNLLTVRKKYKEMEVSLNTDLSEQNMCIKEVQGDGNCMFRAIADQLYGNEMFHRELRKFAMRYIIQEKGYFQDYIINGDVDKYVEYKSKDGVWGDNIELQAFRELYDIPIEIYVCSKEPLKTGLEQNPQNKIPIRLSYHGSSHYNSIKLKDKQNAALLGNQEVGQYEKEMFEKLYQLQQNFGNGQFQQIARAQFGNSISNELDMIFNESKRIFQEQQQKNEEQAIKESIISQEFEEDEEQLMDLVIKESKQDQFQKQQQQNDIEQQLLQKAVEQSKQEQENDFLKQFEDTQYQNALKESEQCIYDDPMNNPIIAQVMSLGMFTLEQILEGYAMHRDDPDMIINYLYENFQ